MIFRWARHPGSAPIARDRLKILLTHEIDIEVPGSTTVPTSGEGIKGFARILPAVFLLGHLLAACSTYQVTSEAALLCVPP